MQGTKGRPQSLHDESNKPHKGRVVDMRAWKTRQRMRNLGRRGWRLESLFWLAALLTAAAAVSAIIACIPFAGQANSIVLCWFFAVVSGVLGSFLYAFRHRRATLLLRVDAICMAVSLVAAIVKVVLFAHGV